MDQGKHRINKLFRVMLVVTASVVLLSFIVVASFVYEVSYKRTASFIDHSPDGKYKLAVYEIGEPVSLEPSQCRIVLSKGLKRVYARDIIIVNDGKHPDTNNFQIKWHDDRAELYVFEYGEDHTYIIYFDGRDEVIARNGGRLKFKATPHNARLKA